jgi:hypothetical protein
MRRRSEVTQTEHEQAGSPPTEESAMVPSPPPSEFPRGNPPTTIVGQPVTEKDLDAEVSALRSLYGATGDKLAEFARRLRAFEAGCLWKLRTVTDETGKERPAEHNKTFEGFIQKELGFSKKKTRAWLTIASHYDSATILDVGPSKLERILTAHPDDRPALVEDARHGATVKEIEEGVRESRDRTGHKRSNAGAKRKPTPTAPATTTRPVEPKGRFIVVKAKQVVVTNKKSKTDKHEVGEAWTVDGTRQRYIVKSNPKGGHFVTVITEKKS